MLLALASLAVALSAPAGACSPDDAHVQWIQPSLGSADVPRDAVVRVLVGDGVSDEDAVTVRLIKNGAEVSATVARESWQGQNLADSRILYTLTPAEALIEGGTYKVDVTHAAGASYSDAATFTVGASNAAAISGVGEVEVRSATDSAGAGEAACDWEQVRTFQVEVEPARPSPEGLDVLRVYRTKAPEDAGTDESWHLVEVIEVDAAGSSQSLTIRGDASRDWGSCFLVVHGGADGAESEASALGCAPAPLQPDDGSDDSGRPSKQEVDESCRGCAAGGSQGGAGLLSALLAGLLPGLLIWSARRSRG